MQLHEHLIGANAENVHDFGMFRDMEDSGKTVGKMGRTVGNMVTTHTARSLEYLWGSICDHLWCEHLDETMQMTGTLE